MKKALLGLLGCAMASAVWAQSAPNVYFTVNSSDTMVQGAAMVLATQAVRQQANVRVLLCGKAADMALKNHSMDKLKPKNVTPAQMLTRLVANGAKVEVCALYLPNKNLKPEALISGVTPGKPEDVAAYLLRENVKVLAF
jgi:predicted peroxiredoxin